MIKELVILCGVIGLFFIVAVTRVSFALEDARNVEGLEEMKHHSLVVAAEAYAQVKKLTETETFIYGSDLIEEKFLLDVDDESFKNQKIKITKDKDSYRAEVVE